MNMSTGTKTSNALKGVQHFWSRLVGVRGSVNAFSDQYSLDSENQAPSQQVVSNFGQVYRENPCDEIARNKLVFFGEIHSMPPIIAFQRQVQAAMADQSETLHVVMEHFSFELQDLLDEYCRDELNFEELVQRYHELGEEGHQLEAYQDLLEDAKKLGVHLHAGFLPRRYAKMLLQEGPERTLSALEPAWLDPVSLNLEGTSFHYNVFESLLSGRSLYATATTTTNNNKTTTSKSNVAEADNNETQPQQPPSDQFRRIFQAQVLKDGAMAQKVSQVLHESPPQEKVLVLAGNGHLLHYCGVPERVLEDHPNLASDTCLVISESADAQSFTDDERVSESLVDRFGREGSNPADFVYLYETPPEIMDEWESVQVKEETRKAYDKVGDSASLPGNARKAIWIMKSMGYTDEQISVVGSDVYNFQGVGNPHVHAKIQPGERVLDVGSGLGVDSFLAADATGADGAVVGIDLSASQVKHANARAQTMGHNAMFAVADMEKIPLPDACIDVMISNGAFCLAPNKRQAFQELYRVLKPGGRIAICTTTTITQEGSLEPGVSWPLCMRMFITKDEIAPMCKKIGFEDIVIDDSDSSMSMELPQDSETIWQEEEESNPNRNKVHVVGGREEFSHLEDFDMDAICARVCVMATKPKPPAETGIATASSTTPSPPSSSPSENAP